MKQNKHVYYLESKPIDAKWAKRSDHIISKKSWITNCNWEN
jgi:hypothetical protein